MLQNIHCYYSFIDFRLCVRNIGELINFTETYAPEDYVSTLTNPRMIINSVCFGQPDRNIATWVNYRVYCTLSLSLNHIRWLSAASLNITMGDVNYYAALLEQYYYGSNASKFQLMLWNLYNKIMQRSSVLWKNMTSMP